MPVYILDMLDLSAEIKSAFEKGEFFIRQTSGSFNGNWSDMDTNGLLLIGLVPHLSSKLFASFFM
jgi:hypothetical protein